MSELRLRLTEADHDADEFIDHGTFEVEGGVGAFLRAVPSHMPHDCEHAERCWVVDVWSDGKPWGIVDDREVTEAVALQLLGRSAGAS